jgi:hypothetical protein
MNFNWVPWEVSVWDKAIQSELKRRSVNRGFQYIDPTTADCAKDDDNWNQ